MEITYCAKCGVEIEGKGIQFRGRIFCGDECCEEFEADFAAKGEPGLADLDGDDLSDVDLEDGDLGFSDGDDDVDDDEFDIDPDDF